MLKVLGSLSEIRRRSQIKHLYESHLKLLDWVRRRSGFVIYEPVKEHETFVVNVKTDQGIVPKRLAHERTQIEFSPWSDADADWELAFLEAKAKRDPKIKVATADDREAIQEGRYLVRWSARAYFGRKPSASERASISDTLRGLEQRGLVACFGMAAAGRRRTTKLRLTSTGLELVRIIADVHVPGASVVALPIGTFARPHRAMLKIRNRLGTKLGREPTGGEVWRAYALQAASRDRTSKG